MTNSNQTYAQEALAHATYRGLAEGLKVGDFVHMAGFPGLSGRVIRIARDKEWADVKWDCWSKRIRNPENLIVEDARGH